VKPGGKVPLTFRFKSGAMVTIDAEARAASAAVAPPARAADAAHQH
jgi:hypothetical protein